MLSHDVDDTEMFVSVNTEINYEQDSPCWVHITDIDLGSQNLHPSMGLQSGGIWVFSAIKITVIHKVDMYCSLSVNLNTRETSHGAQRLWMHFVCICFRVKGGQKPEYPQLELHGWRRHLTGRYKSSGISFLYLGSTFSHVRQNHKILKLVIFQWN